VQRAKPLHVFWRVESSLFVSNSADEICGVLLTLDRPKLAPP
jgi:hypothetical protein